MEFFYVMLLKKAAPAFKQADWSGRDTLLQVAKKYGFLDHYGFDWRI